MPTSSVGEAVRDAEEEVRPASKRAVTEATRSLSALLAAGLPLTRALETTRDVGDARLGPTLDQVLVDVRGGASLAKALSAHPRVFSPLYLGVVRAGERGGALSGVMERLAGEMERQEDLRERIVSALVYPALLTAFGFIAVLILLFVVIPRFADMLIGEGVELPAMTAGLLSVATGLKSYWLLLLVSAVATVIAAGAYLGSEEGRRSLARVVLALPLAGPVRRGVLAGRFARLLSVLLEGGAPLVAALDDTAASLSDPYAAEEVSRIRSEVRVGSPLHRAVSNGSLFPVELSRLIAVGEEAGRQVEFLARAADLFESRAARNIERIVTLLEPAIIVAFGGMVALVALALLQAIYGVNAGAFG